MKKSESILIQLHSHHMLFFYPNFFSTTDTHPTNCSLFLLRHKRTQTKSDPYNLCHSQLLVCAPFFCHTLQKPRQKHEFHTQTHTHTYFEWNKYGRRAIFIHIKSNYNLLFTSFDPFKWQPSHHLLFIVLFVHRPQFLGSYSTGNPHPYVFRTCNDIFLKKKKGKRTDDVLFWECRTVYVFWAIYPYTMYIYIYSSNSSDYHLKLSLSFIDTAHVYV